jgi:hypothetical protein
MFGHQPLSAFEIAVLCFMGQGALGVVVSALLAVSAGLMRPVIATVKKIRRRLRRRIS